MSLLPGTSHPPLDASGNPQTPHNGPQYAKTAALTVSESWAK